MMLEDRLWIGWISRAYSGGKAYLSAIPVWPGSAEPQKRRERQNRHS